MSTSSNAAKTLDLSDLRLFDHHCHGVIASDLSRSEFEALISESSAPPAAGTTRFDSQIGFAVRGRCAPALGLEPFCSANDYLARRSELGATAVNQTLLSKSNIAYLGVETGHSPEQILSPAQMAELAEAESFEIVRLERVAEEVTAKHLAAITASNTALDPVSLWREISAELEHRVSAAIGVKTIAAYRIGLDFTPDKPSDAELNSALSAWASEHERVVRAHRDSQQGGLAGSTPLPRLADATVIRALIWFAIEHGLAIQFHIGYGDDDVDLHRCNPLLLTDLIRLAIPHGARFMLLHCYPFHREAGYLADVFPSVYLDVGLAVNYTGARSAAVIAESLELAPFSKILFSSDAFGLPELYYLGTELFRQGLQRVLQGFVDEYGWPVDEAYRVAELIGYQNALRAYKIVSEE